MFKNRTHAGVLLGRSVQDTDPVDEEETLVLGIARGGAEVAYEVAKVLDRQLSILVVRKLPFPGNPEVGFGAVAEDGSLYIHPRAGQQLSRETVRDVVRQQEAEAARRVEVFRAGARLPEIEGRRVIVVDDGVAMGSTVLAAVACCRNLGAARVIVATPVASPDARTRLEAAADGVMVILCPPFFRAVAESYCEWHDLSDQAVLRIVDEARSVGILAIAADQREEDQS